MMRARILRSAMLGALAAVLLFMGTAASAESHGFSLRWGVITIGGGFAVDGANGFSLSGTAGQIDASSMSGGSFALDGGVWQRPASVHRVYAPIVVVHNP